ncbi:MAG: M23 family metallopeptidase [Treponema sp.]|nr:M23 family metallopeptidase [Treponema sp.]
MKHIFFKNGALRRTLLWAAVIASFVFFISSLPPKTADSGKDQETGTVEGGVGGMAYPDASLIESENVLVSFEGDSQDLGILEPESFSKPRILLYDTYRVQNGDMIGHLARDFGLNEDTLISYNAIKNTRTLQIGRVLNIPNQDGILYTVKKDDTLSQIAEKHKADVQAIQTVNELFSDTVHTGLVLFVPGARMNSAELQEINGELFIWPISSRRITSSYGYRPSPFTGVRSFHSGLDIGAATGTPIYAAMPGRVTTAGWDDSYGNYVVITHQNGYRSLYGHMSIIRVKTGAYVNTETRIGDVGSTGLSTGPHLHFTVYKNGVTVNPRTLLQ